MLPIPWLSTGVPKGQACAPQIEPSYYARHVELHYPMSVGSKPGHGFCQVPPRSAVPGFARKRTRMSKLGSPITLEWSLVYKSQAVHSSLHDLRLLYTEGLVVSSCYSALAALACLQPCHASEVVLAPALVDKALYCGCMASDLVCAKHIALRSSSNA